MPFSFNLIYSLMSGFGYSCKAQGSELFCRLRTGRGSRSVARHIFCLAFNDQVHADLCSQTTVVNMAFGAAYMKIE